MNKNILLYRCIKIARNTSLNKKLIIANIGNQFFLLLESLGIFVEKLL